MMIERNPKIDAYLKNGCMRCKFGGTPDCKVNKWREELKLLREIVLESGLTEELKWGVPCYTFEGKNILIVSAFREYACLSFFKGVLLDDKYSILEKAGENSQSARIIKYNSLEQIKNQANIIPFYIQQAIQVEKSGQKVEFQRSVSLSPELEKIFETDLEFKTAFFSLSLGQQRGYVLYFNQAKNFKTRLNRIEKYRSQILKGEGLHDKYKSQKKK